MAPRRQVKTPAPAIEDTSKFIGYARVSTRDQDPQLQINALTEAGVREQDIYYETVSGASKRRPQYEAMMKDLREGDTLVIWKLDRLGRTVRGVLETFAVLSERGVKIRCITQSIDTSNPMGRLVVVILAAVAEMERELGLERTRAGLERAKAEGRLGGATARNSHQKILEFVKLGFRKGAAAAGLSVPGFQKAVIRARKWQAMQEAKKSVAKAKRKAKR